MNNRGRHVGLVLMAWLCMCACTLCVAPRPARADEVPSFVRVKSGAAANLATSLTAKEKKAYQRAYKACLDYTNQPSTIEVDISDLKLTTSQSLRVGYMLHSNGELFWVSTYDDNNFTSKKIVLPCTYTDAQITRMRSQLNKAVNKALAKVKPGMNAMTKILVLHDYLIDRIDYGDHAKTAYDGLVRRKADCFGFTQTMDLVLRRAGFTTDVAYNFAGNHSWNLVKAGGKWYHIDLTWDNGYTHDIFWGNERCRLFLLQPDSRMKNDGYTSTGHGRWWSSHKCTTNTYKRQGEPDNNFAKEAAKSKLYSKGFVVDGLKYVLNGTKTAKLVSVTTGAKKTAASVTVPASVRYKGMAYRVTGIEARALKGTKAKTLYVSTKYLAKSRVKNCLAGSKVKNVRLQGAAMAKKKAYRSYFAKANSGKAVKLG